MKFTLAHERAGLGTDLKIAVDAEGSEAIASVTTRYDGFELARCRVDGPPLAGEALNGSGVGRRDSADECERRAGDKHLGAQLGHAIEGQLAPQRGGGTVETA